MHIKNIFLLIKINLTPSAMILCWIVIKLEKNGDIFLEYICIWKRNWVQCGKRDWDSIEWKIDFARSLFIQTQQKHASLPSKYACKCCFFFFSLSTSRLSFFSTNSFTNLCHQFRSIKFSVYNANKHGTHKEGMNNVFQTLIQLSSFFNSFIPSFIKQPLTLCFNATIVSFNKLPWSYSDCITFN